MGSRILDLLDLVSDGEAEKGRNSVWGCCFKKHVQLEVDGLSYMGHGKRLTVQGQDNLTLALNPKHPQPRTCIPKTKPYSHKSKHSAKPKQEIETLYLRPMGCKIGSSGFVTYR